MPKYPWIEIPLALGAVAGPLVVVVLRLICTRKITHENGNTEERAWGIGVRMIQLIGLLLLIPIIALLTLEAKMNTETAGALLGVALGYTLSGIEKAVPKRSK